MRHYYVSVFKGITQNPSHGRHQNKVRKFLSKGCVLGVQGVHSLVSM